MAKLALLGVLALVASPHVVARIPTGDSPGGATAAYGAVWVANDASGTLARIDPATNRVTRRVRLRPGLFSVAHGFGALWAVNYKTGALSRVEPRSGRARSVRVGGVPFDVVAAFGRVWVTAWEAGKLVEVDPRSLRVVRRIAIGPRPTGLHVAGGALWIGFGRSATEIARLDPKSRKIQRVPVGVRAPSWFVSGAPGLSGPARIVAVRPLLDKGYAAVDVEALLPNGSHQQLLALNAPRPQWFRRYWLERPVELPAGTSFSAKYIPLPPTADDPKIQPRFPLQVAIDYVMQ